MARRSRPNTKLFYGESVPTPRNDVLDIEPIAAIAHANGVPLIVDNTVPTPTCCAPSNMARTWSSSATKYLGGHGTSIGGVIVDSGNFDYGADPEKFPKFNQPAPGYHGLTHATWVGLRIRCEPLLHPEGARLPCCATPALPSPLTNAFNIGIGLETSPAHRTPH